MDKRIIVTGAAGFIASHLIENLFKQGFFVIGIDNFDPFYNKKYKTDNLAILKKNGGDQFEFHEIDITNKEKLFSIAGKIDAIIHIAAKAGIRPSIEKPNDYITTNILGTQNILDFAVNKKCNKLVFASSSSIYGNNFKVPFSEDDIVDKPISTYAFTKKANELQIHTYHSLYNIDAVCLRFFTVYGPRQRPDLAIRKFTELIKAKEAIDMYGDGETGRDYTYISDIVNGISAALDYLRNNSKVYEVVNLGSHAPVKLKVMINTIAESLNVTPQINVLPMQAGDVENTFADISKAEQLFGYKPQVSFKEGIDKFINWYNLHNK